MTWLLGSGRRRDPVSIDHRSIIRWKIETGLAPGVEPVIRAV
jgi:hypothetical protein